MVEYITDINRFLLLLSSDQKLVIDYYAPWCAPCKAISPLLDKLAHENPDFKFIKINVDTESFRELLSYLDIRSIPTFHFIHKKYIYISFSGTRNLSLSLERFKSLLSVIEPKSSENLNQLLNSYSLISKSFEQLPIDDKPLENSDIQSDPEAFKSKEELQLIDSTIDPLEGNLINVDKLNVEYTMVSQSGIIHPDLKQSDD